MDGDAVASLHRALYGKEWNAVRKLLWSPPTSSRDEALVATATRSSRSSIFQLEQSLDALLQRQLHECKDALGATILHYACSIPDIPVDVVVALLDAAAATVPSIEEPRQCHCSIQEDLNGNNEHSSPSKPPVPWTDMSGGTLAHYAAASGTATTLAVLLERLPHSTHFIGTSLSCSPCRLAWYCYFRKHSSAVGGSSSSSSSLALKERVRQLTSASLYSMETLPKAVRELWRKTVLLVRHYVKMHVPTQRPSPTPAQDESLIQAETTPVHSLLKDLVAIIRYGSVPALDCPTMAVWFALQTGDLDLLEAVDDDCFASGNLLHVAAASRPLRPLLFSQSPNGDVSGDNTIIPPRISAYMARQAHGGQSCWQHAQCSVVTQLCALEPLAASRPQYSPGGPWPLHIAIAHGQPWSDGIDAIVAAYPAALVIDDPVSGLEPILQAAEAPKCTLTTLFELIRHHPDLLVTSVDKDYDAVATAASFDETDDDIVSSGDDEDSDCAY